MHRGYKTNTFTQIISIFFKAANQQPYKMQSALTTIIAALFLVAIHGAAAACTPDFFSVSVVQFSTCADADAPGTDPAPMVAFMQNQLGCQNIIGGDVNPLVGTIKAHQCSQGFTTTNDVPGFSGDSIIIEPPCLPGDKCP